MISRVADSCYWLGRYVERAESVARLISVNRLIVLDAGIRGEERWRPVLAVLGEVDLFETAVGADGFGKDEVAEDYLTWSEHSPGSLKETLRWARENARKTREVISLEMWEALNRGWQWLDTEAARREYRKDRVGFFQNVRSLCAELVGVAECTMLHEEPFDFMRIGSLLERLSQTARLMDVKHHRPLDGGVESDVETPWEAAQWTAQLRLCAALEPFFKRSHDAPSGPGVAEFLLRDPAFPRSVRFCLMRIAGELRRIENRLGQERPSRTTALVTAELARSEAVRIEDLRGGGLAAEVTRLVNASFAIDHQLRADFFEPERPG